MVCFSKCEQSFYFLKLLREACTYHCAKKLGPKHLEHFFFESVKLIDLFTGSHEYCSTTTQVDL